MARKKTKPTDRKKGSSRMREQGYKLVTLWLSPDEHAIIKAACRLVRTPLATYIRKRAGDVAATEIMAAGGRIPSDRGYATPETLSIDWGDDEDDTTKQE